MEISADIRTSRFALRTLLGLILCGFSASALHADGLSPIACPPDQTLQYYKNQFSSGGTACSNGILNFSNFNFQLYQSSGPGTPLTASQIDLSPIGTLGQTGVTGFAITGLNNSQISVAPGQSVTYVLNWFFVIDSGPIASGASLGMDPPSGDITVSQYYCLDSLFQSGPVYNGSAPSCTISLQGMPSDVQSLSVTNDIPNDLTDSVTFNPPAQDFADVMTVIQLNGGENGASFDSVSGTTQIDPATGTGSPTVPEPDSLIPLMLQFVIAAGILFLRHRRCEGYR